MTENDGVADVVDELIAPPTKRRAALFVAFPLTIVMVLLVAVLITRKSAADRADFNPLVGKAAPAIVGTTLDGKSFDLDRLRGKWVVVNFFATWCVPCQIEHPLLLSFDRRHSQAGDVQLVTVVFNDEPDAVRAFYDKTAAAGRLFSATKAGWPSSTPSFACRTPTSSTRSASCAPASPASSATPTSSTPPSPP